MFFVYLAIVFGILAIPAICSSSTFMNSPRTTPNTQPTRQLPKLREPIFHDRTLIRRYAAGQDIELTYKSNDAYVATLRISPTKGKFNTMHMYEVKDSENIREIDVPITDDGIAELCGYEFRQSEYMIAFEAPRSTDYTIELQSGNTCETE